MATALEGFGATITFQSGFYATITAVNHTGYKRAAHDTSHNLITSGWRTFFLSNVKDAGSLEITFWYNPNSVPPIDQVAESITLTFAIPSGGVTGATVVCSGGLTDHSSTGPFDGLMVGTATLKFSGVPVWTAST